VGAGSSSLSSSSSVMLSRSHAMVCCFPTDLVLRVDLCRFATGSQSAAFFSLGVRFGVWVCDALPVGATGSSLLSFSSSMSTGSRALVHCFPADLVLLWVNLCRFDAASAMSPSVVVVRFDDDFPEFEPELARVVFWVLSFVGFVLARSSSVGSSTSDSVGFFALPDFVLELERMSSVSESLEGFFDLGLLVTLLHPASSSRAAR